MSKVKLVIEIDEELYEAYKGKPPMLGDAGMDMIAQAIANGTPLPKGHGRLIDADKLDTRERGNNSQRTMWWNIDCIVKDAPTIIEADESEEENE